VPAARGETEAVEHEVHIDAVPETVFEHFTDPLKLVRWMGSEATLDPRPGGVFRLVLFAGAVVLGEFSEVTPYRRVVFTWGWEDEVFAVPPASTEVEVELTPQAGGTHVRLRHRRVPEWASAFVGAGWSNYVERLAVAATGDDPGPDPAQAKVGPFLMEMIAKGEPA
jgi:uncharacterized protein YndB with AHSA1/START domain